MSQVKRRSEFDYTMMSTFQTCQRKYDFRINQGIVGRKPPIAADFGKCIHQSLDAWYKEKDVDHAVELFKATYVESEEDDKRTHKMGEWILRNYHSKYVDQPFKVLSTEREFTLPLPNGNKLIGRIDKIVEWDGAIWGMDHKTTSALGDSYMRFHTPNLQFSGYTWAIQQLGFPQCAGILVDAILVAKGLLDTTSRGKLVPLRRDFAYRSPGDIEEYLSVVGQIQQDIELSESTGVWIPNFEACTDYGECPYRKICKEPKEFRDKIIAADYVHEPWDPRGEEKKE